MKRNIVWLVLSCLMALSLLAASCAKAEEKTPAAKEAAPVVKEAAPVVKEAAPVVKEAAPAVKEAAPAKETGMVKVTLTKLDGTKIEKMVEKPRYGGQLNSIRAAVVFGFDPIYTVQWRVPTIHWTNDRLAIGDWKRSPAGTNEASFWPTVYYRPELMVPHLAESWEVPDAQTIIYHIRKGVRWALNPDSAASRLVNGREMTADDVVFSLKLFWETPVSYIYTNYPVSERPVSVRAIDKYTVEMKSSPETHILKTHETTAGYVFIYPREVIAKYGDLKDWRNSVGTGPFMITDYVDMSSITLKRNPTHFGVNPIFPEDRMPYVDTYKVLIILDAATGMAAMRTGKADFTSVSSYDDVESLLKTNPEVMVQGLPKNAPDVLAGRMDKPELPFKDIKVRKAMNMALDYQAIIKDYYRGYAQHLNTPIINWPDYADMRIPFEELPADIQEIYTYNPVKAKQLLTEAGYPDGFKTVIDVAAGVRADCVTILQGYFAAIGIDMQLQVREAGVYGAIEQGRTHQEMLDRYTADSDPLSFWTTHPLKGHNAAMVNDPWINAFRDKIAGLVYDEPKRRQLYKAEFIPYFYRQAFYIIPPATYTFNLWHPWLKGYEGGANVGTGHYAGWPRYAWIDQELKKAMGYK